MLCICLSGGGANGAYEVGALRYLLCEKGLKPEIYCGTSVGAINSSFLAQYPIGEDSEGILRLEQLWDKLDTSSIYTKWYNGWLWYLPVLWKKSVYNTQPVRDLIENNLDAEKIRSSGKKLRVIGVSLSTGECKTWGEEDFNIVKGVQASSSFPIFFTPVDVAGVAFSDGGLRNITPLRTAIDLGATEIYVITCSPERITFEANPDLSVLNQVTRTLDIMCDEINRNDIRKALLYNELCKYKKDGNKRFVDIKLIQPKAYLGDSLDFSHAKNRGLFELGYQDACNFDKTE